MHAYEEHHLRQEDRIPWVGELTTNVTLNVEGVARITGPTVQDLLAKKDLEVANGSRHHLFSLIVDVGVSHARQPRQPRQSVRSASHASLHARLGSHGLDARDRHTADLSEP